MYFWNGKSLVKNIMTLSYFGTVRNIADTYLPILAFEAVLKIAMTRSMISCMIYVFIDRICQCNLRLYIPDR